VCGVAVAVRPLSKRAERADLLVGDRGEVGFGAAAEGDEQHLVAAGALEGAQTYLGLRIDEQDRLERHQSGVAIDWQQPGTAVDVLASRHACNPCCNPRTAAGWGGLFYSFVGPHMNRRHLLCAATTVLLPASAWSSAPGDPMQFLSPTRYVNSEHPDIKAVVAQIAPLALDPRERAVRIHDYVRDQVKFGWTSDFYDQPASEVLQSGVGFCNTEGTLFAAMLRAAEIAARQHFVDIDAKILSPLIDPGTAYVDHSFVKVWLGDRWYRTDSYIVDRTLHAVASLRLMQSGQVLGFGVHRDGTSDWDGRTDSFCQFVQSQAYPALSTRDYGVYDDVGAFYASGNGVNRLNLALRLGFGFFARSANRRIEALRSVA
jgi:transglutaminase-like putative cysteine protease